MKQPSRVHAVTTFLACLLLACGSPPSTNTDGGTSGGGGGGGSGGGTGGGSGGGTGGGSGGGGGTYVTGAAGVTAYQAQCGTLLDAFCEYNLSCGTVTSQAGCEARFGTALDPCDGRIAAGLKDERLELNAALFTTCIQAVGDSQACGVPPDLGECEDAIRGRQARGATCFDSGECADADYCDASSSCPGVCAARVAAGGTVTAGAECAAGLESDGSTCMAPVAVGGSCSGTSPKPCVAGAYCDAASGTCTAVKTAGAACAEREECARNLACVGGTCTVLGGAGAACKLSDISCKFDLTCKLMDFATLSGECQAPAAAGATCFLDMDCKSDLYCAGVSFGLQMTPGTCSPRLAVGAACTASQFGNPCVDTATCTAGTCTLKKGEGQACTPSAEDCADGLSCQGGTCKPSSCTDPTP